MFMAQQYVGQFRRKRLLIALSIATLVLVLTLAFRYIEEKSRIEQQAMDFADKAIMRFDRMFSPLEVSASNMLGLVGVPCQDVRFPLIEKIASLQTVRASLLIDDARNTVVGFTAVGPDTTELVHAATIAIAGEVPIDRLWHAVPAYPTISEVWLRLLETAGR